MYPTPSPGHSHPPCRRHKTLPCSHIPAMPAMQAPSLVRSRSRRSFSIMCHASLPSPCHGHDHLGTSYPRARVAPVCECPWACRRLDLAFSAWTVLRRLPAGNATSSPNNCSHAHPHIRRMD